MVETATLMDKCHMIGQFKVLFQDLATCKNAQEHQIEISQILETDIQWFDVVNLLEILNICSLQLNKKTYISFSDLLKELKFTEANAQFNPTLLKIFGILESNSINLSEVEKSRSLHDYIFFLQQLVRNYEQEITSHSKSEDQRGTMEEQFETSSIILFFIVSLFLGAAIVLL